jgi:putative hemolysin
MEILLLTTLIALNGVFAMSEIALMMARRARLARLAEEGSTSAAAAMTLHDEPTRFLSTVQVGITSIGILNGIIGEAALAGPLAVWLQTFGAPVEASQLAATALVVIIITYLTIVIGELVPKRIGQLDPERIACRLAQPMQWLAVLMRPFVRLLSLSTNAVLRLLRAQPSARQDIIEEEIHALLQEGSASGAIEAQEREMVRNVFRLDDRPVESLMTPRADIVFSMPRCRWKRICGAWPIPITRTFRSAGAGSTRYWAYSTPDSCSMRCWPAPRPASPARCSRPRSCRNASAGWICWSSSAHPAPT